MFLLETGLVVLLAAASSSFSKPPTAAETYINGDLYVSDPANPGKILDYLGLESGQDLSSLSRTTGGRRLAYSRLNTNARPFTSDNAFRISTSQASRPNNAFLGNQALNVNSGYLGNSAIIGYQEDAASQLNLAYPSNTASQLNLAYPSNTASQFNLRYPSNSASQFNLRYPSNTASQFNLGYPSNTASQLNLAYPAQNANTAVIADTVYPDNTIVSAYPTNTAFASNSAFPTVAASSPTTTQLLGNSATLINRGFNVFPAVNSPLSPNSVYRTTGDLTSRPTTGEVLTNLNTNYQFPVRTRLNPSNQYLIPNNPYSRSTLFNSNPFPDRQAYTSVYPLDSQLSNADRQSNLVYPSNTFPLGEQQLRRTTGY